MAKKKSYNPLKMWGSYVGFSLGIIIFLSFGKIIDFCWGQVCFSSYNLVYPFVLSFETILIIVTLLLFSILGFLIGWGIHSIIRKVIK